MIEKKLEISMLYDFYSQLLTEKQRQIIDLYHNQDFSLGEIAEEFNVSRQAIYDTIKRTEKILYRYEEKLNLIHLFHSKMQYMEKVFSEIVKLQEQANKYLQVQEINDQITKIKELIVDILNN